MKVISVFIIINLSCWTKGTKFYDECLADSSHQNVLPEFQWRHPPHNTLHLEIYYQPHFCDFSSHKPNEFVKNPACYIKDAPLDIDPTLQVEFVNLSIWRSDPAGKDLLNSIDGLDFYIQSALFRIGPEPQGTIECALKIRGQPLIKKIVQLRSSMDDPTVFVSAIYNPKLCNVGECSHDLLRMASRNLTYKLQTDFFKLRIEPMEMEYIGDGGNGSTSSQRMSFRVRPRSWSKAPSAAIVTAAAWEEDPALAIHLRFEERVAAAVASLSSSWPRVDAAATRSGTVCKSDARWPSARSGRVATDACGKVRRCVYVDDRRGVRWQKEPEEEVEDDATNTKASTCHLFPHTQKINDILKKVKLTESGTGVEEIKDLESILTDSEKEILTDADVWNIAEILENVKEPEKLSGGSISSITGVVNRLLTLDEQQNDKSFIKHMQEKATTSNMLLKSLDKILYLAPLSSSEELEVKEKLTTFVTDVSRENYTSLLGGFAVLNRKETKFNTLDVKPLPRNTSVKWLMEQDISVAVLVPSNLISSLDQSTHRLVISVFWDSKLFGERISPATTGHIFGISIDGKHIQLKDPIMLFFKKSNKTSYLANSRCGFWDFEADGGKGNWSQAGCTLTQYPGYEIDVCLCSHLTHFGKLLFNSGGSDVEISDSYSLSMITVIGCSLSLVGLAGVFLSAYLFPGKGSGRLLQLQLCGAQSLLMIALLWDTVSSDESNTVCLLRGLLLHWSVLALGTWSLAAALYQHRRLTKPLLALKTDPRFLPRASAVAWGLPAFVCCLVATLSSNAYIPPSCYPFGIDLILAVIIPLGCIVVANTIIYSLIIWSICYCSPNSPELRECHNNSSRTIQKVVASAYLFCLLGLCWLFGFLHWEYPFCITASLQGVSHFVFCVILDRATRRSWKLYKKRQQSQLSTFKSWPRSSLLQKSH